MGFFETIGDAGKAAFGGIGMGLSAIGRAIANKRIRNRLDQQERENNAWYDQRYNELGTERADAQAALSAMRAAQAQRMSAARGASAVMGASAGSVAAEKAGANSAMAQNIGEINANNEKFARGVESSYMAEKRRIAGVRDSIDNATGQAMTDAGSQWSALIAKTFDNKTT